MTRKAKLWAGAIVALAVVLALVAVYLGAGPQSTQVGQGKISVRLKWLHQAQFAGFYFAQQAGFYRDEGLDVTLNPGGIDFPAIQLVASGSEQFGVAGADQILLAIEKGVPIVAIAVIYQKNPVVFMSMPNSGITTPQDFIGKRVGVKLGASADLSYRALLAHEHINPALITEIPIKYEMTPLFTGQVDVWPGYVNNEPIVARQQGYALNVLWAADYGVNPYSDTIFTTESMVRNQPDLVRRFLNATLKGWQQALADPKQAVAYTLKYSDQLKPETELASLQASVQIIQPTKEPIGWMTLPRWQATEAVMIEAGAQKTPLPLEKVYSDRFVREIYGR